MGNKKTFGHLAALLTIVIWGTTFISTKILLVDFKPVEILFFRFVMGFVILLAISPKRLKTKSRKEELTFVLAGLCGICLYYLLENIALTYTLASNVGVIISVAPFFTAIAIASCPASRVFIGMICALRGLSKPSCFKADLRCRLISIEIILLHTKIINMLYVYKKIMPNSELF